MKVPKTDGFFWGKWLTKNGAPTPFRDEWEVMHVVESWENEDDPVMTLLVMVPGEDDWQPLENFEWGDEVRRED